MKNWLGQEIEVGTIVYRGARDGNTSSYKVGQVTKVNEETRKITVNWKWEPQYSWQLDRMNIKTESRPRAVNSSGTSDIDTAVVIDLDHELLNRDSEFIQRALDNARRS